MKKLIATLTLATTLTLVGCSTGTTQEDAQVGTETSQEVSMQTGTLVLSLNPEVAVHYDEAGKVTSIEGRNDDGEAIAADYTGYEGKDAHVVVQELITLFGDAGFLVEEVEGEGQELVIEIEEGSNLPSDNFLGTVATSAQKAVNNYQSDDADGQVAEANVQTSQGTLLSLDEAKQVAFDHAGVDGANAQFDDHELDSDDGLMHYELEFHVNGQSYEYDIDALTGDILSSEGGNGSASTTSGSDQDDDSEYDDQDDTTSDDSQYDDQNDDDDQDDDNDDDDNLDD